MIIDQQALAIGLFFSGILIGVVLLNRDLFFGKKK